MFREWLSVPADYMRQWAAVITNSSWELIFAAAAVVIAVIAVIASYCQHRATKRERQQELEKAAKARELERAREGKAVALEVFMGLQRASVTVDDLLAYLDPERLKTGWLQVNPVDQMLETIARYKAPAARSIDFLPTDVLANVLKAYEGLALLAEFGSKVWLADRLRPHVETAADWLTDARSGVEAWLGTQGVRIE